MAPVVLIFLLVFAAAYLAGGFSARRQREKIRRRIEDCNLDPGAPDVNPETDRKSIFQTIDGLIHGLSLSAFIKKELNKANWSLKVSEFLVIVVLSASFVPLLVLLVTEREMLAVTLMAGGGAFPIIYLKQRQAARKKVFAGQLLDAIMIISNSLKSGYSFLQAIDLVSQEMAPPISEEFQKVIQEIKLGIPFEKAVDRMTQRVESDDLDLVMTGVKIQREVGGNLTEILDKIAHTIRERIRIKGQIQTLTAQGRLSGLILGLLPVALGMFLFLINPEYVRTLFTHPVGRMMVAFAVVSQAIGIFIIKKIINIKV